MLTLYHCHDARSFRPLWTLEEMGLPYELKMLPFPPRVAAPDYLSVNPLGTIPTFFDGEMRMTESVAIWWLGQSGNGGQDWTNVLHGSIRGREISGDWADVPAAPSMGAGTLYLQLVIRDGRVVEIRKKRQVGDDFGGEVWTRAD